jgi:hypothetical protein
MKHTEPTPLAALLAEIARRRRIRAQYEWPRAAPLPSPSTNRSPGFAVGANAGGTATPSNPSPTGRRGGHRRIRSGFDQ